MPDGQLITAHDAIMAHLTALLPDSRFARRGRVTGMGQSSDMAFMVSGPVRACQSLFWLRVCKNCPSLPVRHPPQPCRSRRPHSSSFGRASMAVGRPVQHNCADGAFALWVARQHPHDPSFRIGWRAAWPDPCLCAHWGHLHNACCRPEPGDSRASGGLHLCQLHGKYPPSGVGHQKRTDEGMDHRWVKPHRMCLYLFGNDI
jgi:hypothetical protein